MYVSLPSKGSKQKCMDGRKPGVASSYIFSKKPGDKVTISGPRRILHQSPSESCMLVVLEWRRCVLTCITCSVHSKRAKVTFW